MYQFKFLKLKKEDVLCLHRYVEGNFLSWQMILLKLEFICESVYAKKVTRVFSLLKQTSEIRQKNKEQPKKVFTFVLSVMKAVKI